MSDFTASVLCLAIATGWVAYVGGLLGQFRRRARAVEDAEEFAEACCAAWLALAAGFLIAVALLAAVIVAAVVT